MGESIVKNSAINTTLLQAKLRSIDELISTNIYSTDNDLASAVSLEIQNFLASIAVSQTASVATDVTYGSLNLSQHYRDFWSAVGNDLSALYAETDRLSAVITDNHNYIMADVQALLLSLKTANAFLATYELYNPATSNTRKIVENFNDITNLDLGSTLLSGKECNVDTIQGVTTLSIDTDNLMKKDKINSITISNATSNGSVFNNTTLLSTINSGDFYLFQYEYTSAVYTTYKLILDFTIKLTDLEIINYIRIVPNNFGTTTWPKITAIDISPDGVNLTDIRSQILGSNTDDSQFTLAPYMSNYAGEGRYSFLPGKAQYVHFRIEQTSPYFDNTRNLYRWAIGIKNIEIIGRTYNSPSMLISKDFTIGQGIAEVALDADELPQMLFANSILASAADIKHDISVDSGMSWTMISPQYLDTQDPTAPEILYVNAVDTTGATSGTNHLNTTVETNSIRYRIRMNRNANEIADSSLLPYFTPIVRKVQLSITPPEVI